MLRIDGKYTIYIVRHLYKHEGEWTNSGDCDAVFGYIDEKLKNQLRKLQTPFMPSGECWQRIGIHGTYDEIEAIKLVGFLNRNIEQHTFGVCKVDIAQKRKMIYGAD